MKIHRHPPAKDNPGRVSEGAAEDYAKRAELAHVRESQGLSGHAEEMRAMRYMPACAQQQVKNKRKAQRKARRK